MKLLKTTLLPMIIALSFLVSASFAAANDSGKSPLIIDVRTDAEWAVGHLDGAVLIPYQRIGDAIAKVVADKDETIYLYCRTGRRSSIAEATLERSGYKNLINLKTLENASKVLNRAVIK